MPLVAGVDSSTQSTKVELRDADSGALVGTGRAPHPSVTPPIAEQDPSHWWHAFEHAYAQALAADSLAASDVAAISVAGQQHGLVALDDHDRVIRPAKLWNDTTSAADARWLLDQLPAGAAGWAQACGSVPVAAFTITKLSWLHRVEPDAWARLARVALPHDWLTLQLTGRLVTDRGDASGTGYWSPVDGRYRWDLLAIVDGTRDWAHSLPEVLGPIEPAGSWRDTVVGPGTGDNMAAAMGIGLLEGDIAISLGTSGTVYGISPHPTSDQSGAVAGFADASGRFLPLVCTLNATKVTDAVGRLLRLDHAEFDAAALAAPAGAGGVTVLPYFDGERTPNRPDARGVMSGLGSDVEATQLARAAVEGVTCGLLDGLDALVDQARLDGQLHLVGGGARSAAFRQVVADLSGRPVTTTDLAEAVATGACVQAAATLRRRSPEEVRADWAIDAAMVTDPSIDAGLAAEIRGRYAALRDRSG